MAGGAGAVDARVEAWRVVVGARSDAGSIVVAAAASPWEMLWALEGEHSRHGGEGEGEHAESLCRGRINDRGGRCQGQL